MNNSPPAQSLTLSVIIPCHNEEGSLEKVVNGLVEKLGREKIDYEIIIVDDHSTDRTASLADELAERVKKIRVVHRTTQPSFGRAIRTGLDTAKGDVIIPFMGDASDEAEDVAKFYHEMGKGYDVIYGSRFRKGTVVKDYPIVKLIINRIANNFIRFLFFIKENDITNCFKAYRRYVIEKIKPIEATEFNITVELPLKALAAGFNKKEVPVNWYGRDSGVSKHRLTILSKKYLSTVLKIWWRYRFRT